LGCIFCDIDNCPDHEIVFRSERVLFVQSEKYQGALEHSGVIIPVAHRETVFDLTPEEFQATYTLLHEVKRYMDEEFRPDGYNVGWNCGKVGGQHVFHAHMHVIPRFRDEPLAGMGIRTYLKSDANVRS
jgi:histidine triad (HIT) family protein